MLHATSSGRKRTKGLTTCCTIAAIFLITATCITALHGHLRLAAAAAAAADVPAAADAAAAAAAAAAAVAAAAAAAVVVVAVVVVAVLYFVACMEPKVCCVSCHSLFA